MGVTPVVKKRNFCRGVNIKCHNFAVEFLSLKV